MNWLASLWGVCLVVTVVLALLGIPIWVSLGIGAVWLVLFIRALYRSYYFE